MQAQGKVAVIFGGSGAVGSAVAQALAREGADVHLGARNRERLESVADGIRTANGAVATFLTDVLDPQDATEQMARLAMRVGTIDIVVNATGFPHNQGKWIDVLSAEEFSGGYAPLLSAMFNIAKAVAPHMGGERPGVIVTTVAPAGPMAMPGHLGHIVGCAGVEAFTRALASELGPRNVRVLCLRSHAIAGAVEAGSHTKALFTPKAEAMGMTLPEWLEGAAGATMLGRLPTLSQVGETVAFLASDHAGAMTGTVVNMTAGLTTG